MTCMFLDAKQQKEFDLYEQAIGDAYARMATNECPDYRALQMKKCEKLLEKMTALVKDGLAKKNEEWMTNIGGR